MVKSSKTPTSSVQASSSQAHYLRIARVITINGNASIPHDKPSYQPSPTSAQISPPALSTPSINGQRQISGASSASGAASNSGLKISSSLFTFIAHSRSQLLQMSHRLSAFFHPQDFPYDVDAAKIGRAHD